MFGMSNEQLLGLLRQLLPTLGTIAVMFGIIGPEQVGPVSAVILNIAGAVLIIWSATWSLIDKTQASMIAKVDTIAKDPESPVQGVIMVNNIEGREIAANLPGPETVAAGTPAATELAKAA